MLIVWRVEGGEGSRDLSYGGPRGAGTHGRALTLHFSRDQKKRYATHCTVAPLQLRFLLLALSTAFSLTLHLPYIVTNGSSCCCARLVAGGAVFGNPAADLLRFHPPPWRLSSTAHPRYHLHQRGCSPRRASSDLTLHFLWVRWGRRQRRKVQPNG
jgi:hypothetical protein